MKKLCLAIALISLTTSAIAADTQPTREHFAPPGYESAYHNWHYTPALKVGQTVYISGIPASGGGTYEDKVRRMFGEMRKQLELAGASMADVVELTSFHTQPTDTASFREEFKTFEAVHHEFFTSNYPAWTAVGTTALLSPGAVVEMRAVAVIGSGHAPKADIPLPKPAAPAK